MSDPWIPLNIQWLPELWDQPLYIRISGLHGGEIELKADPETGALVQAIVLTAPPFLAVNGIGEPPIGEPSRLEDGRAPVVTKALWRKPDFRDIDRDPQPGATASFSDYLRFYIDDQFACLRFSEIAATRYIRSGSVVVGISQDGNLSEICTFGPRIFEYFN
ncbi:hypothetical protein [Nocardia sp. R7R-8]|uniref:hypothetical protein n=1 Tax=Nocardia sp. R7R-8 TaxID=3459304 RepID=UPI00403DD39B